MSELVELCAQPLALVREHAATWRGPSAGSPLAGDDAVWPHAPVSEVVRDALHSALDHLDLVHRIVTDPRPPPPHATYSALRGALIGACLALWVLQGPDDDLRRARGLALVAENYRNRGLHHQDQAASVDQGRAEHARQRLELARRRTAELEPVRGRLPNTRVNLTAIIEGIAATMPRTEDDAGPLLMGLWRSGGGSVHGYGWGAMVRGGVVTVDTDEDRNLTAFVLRADRDEIADNYSACAALVVLAGGLLRQLSKAPCLIQVGR